MGQLWMDPFLEYFKKDIIPDDPKVAKRLRREVSKYNLVGVHLYRRGFSFLLLRCLIIIETNLGRIPQGHNHIIFNLVEQKSN
ncbi:hypothetical protein CR513_04489, partial [Mucuna pruriens]